MSRAFVKEDVDPPERSSRPRAASGLPPGATNYITASGAGRLRQELIHLTVDRAANAERIREREELLASVEIVELPDDQRTIAFGARVVVRSRDGHQRTFRIVGVDEVALFPDAVTWISAEGKALLASEPGGRVVLADGEAGEIVSVDYPAD